MTVSLNKTAARYLTPIPQALPFQAALDLNSSRMMRRNVSSNFGACPAKYSRSAELINVS